MKLRLILVVAFVLLAVVPMAFVGFAILQATEENALECVNAELEYVSSIQVARLNEALNDYIEGVELISINSPFSQHLSIYFEKEEPEDKEFVKTLLLDAKESVSKFRRLCVIDFDGQVVVSTDAMQEGQSCKGEEFFTSGLEEISITVMQGDEGQTLLLVAGPIVSENKTIAVLLVEADAERILSVVSDYSGVGKSGETVIAMRAEDGAALFITPLRFDKDAAFTRRVGKEWLNVPITQALLGKEDLFIEYRDYRGELVFAVTKYVELVDWGLVVKRDSSEAFEPFERIRAFILFALLFAGLISAIIGFILSVVVSTPLIKLSKAVEKITKGNFDVKLEKSRVNEIQQLSNSFSRVLASLKLAIVRTGMSKEEIGLGEAVKAKKEAEKKYLNIVQISVDPIFSFDSGLIITTWNPSAKQVFGYSESEMVGKSVLSLFSEKTVSEMEQKLASLIAVGKGTLSETPIETNVLAKEGRKVAIELAVSVRESADEYTAMAIARDITERKKTAEDLKKEKDFSEGIIDTAQAILLVLDPGGKIVKFNPYMEKVSGYKLEEVKGKDWFTTFLPKQDYNKIRKIFKRRLKATKPQINTNPIITKKGKEIQIEWADKVLKDKNGKVTGLIAIGNNVTEQQKAEKKLRESEKKLSFLITNSLDVMFRLDLEKGYTFISPSVKRLLGYTPENYYNDPLFYRKITHPDDLPKIEKMILDLQKGRAPPKRFELRQFHKDGHIVYEEFTFTSVYDKKGKIIGLEGVSRDVTEKKQAEEQLKESEEKFRKLAEGSHDLISITDLKAKTIWANNAWKKIFGSKLPGPDSFPQIHPEDKAAVVKAWAGLLKNKKSIVGLEYRYRHDGKKYQHFKTNAKVITIVGQPMVFISARNVTAEKIAEKSCVSGKPKVRSKD